MILVQVAPLPELIQASVLQQAVPPTVHAVPAGKQVIDMQTLDISVSIHADAGALQHGLPPAHDPPSATHVTQTPAWQVLFVPQAMPLASGSLMQAPSDVRQTPRLHASSSAVQLVPAPEVQTPFWQLSPTVQLSLSALQLVPFALAGLVHSPVAGSQTPASWHWSCAVQTIVASTTHWPSSQARQPPQLFPWQAHWPSAWQSSPSPQTSPTWASSGSQVVVVSLQRWHVGQVGWHAQEPQSTGCWQLLVTLPHRSAQVCASDSGWHAGGFLSLPLPLPP
jgi:hypothetical protein